MEAIKESTMVLDKCHRCGEVGYYHTYDGMETTCPKCLGIKPEAEVRKAKKEKPVHFAIGLPKEMHTQLFKYAEAKSITASGVVRMAVKEFFERLEKESN